MRRCRVSPRSSPMLTAPRHGPATHTSVRIACNQGRNNGIAPQVGRRPARLHRSALPQAGRGAIGQFDQATDKAHFRPAFWAGPSADRRLWGILDDVSSDIRRAFGHFDQVTRKRRERRTFPRSKSFHRRSSVRTGRDRRGEQSRMHSFIEYSSLYPFDRIICFPSISKLFVLIIATAADWSINPVHA